MREGLKPATVTKLSLKTAQNEQKTTQVFNDITADTNTVPCKQGSPDCSREPPDKIGVLTGFNSGVGYDLTTGLGSVNAENLVNNWPTPQ